jgi:large subunit ribosomal protein L30
VSEKAQRTIRIKWIRSGIGFSYHQKHIVRSLGLKKLNQEVEKPDTPQIRGLVAKVPHLVKIVEAASKAAWTQVPEYTIYPPEAVPSKPAKTAQEASADETARTEAPASAAVMAAPAISGHEEQPVVAQAAPEAATGTSGDLAAAKGSESADPIGKGSARAGEEVSPEEGQRKA